MLTNAADTIEAATAGTFEHSPSPDHPLALFASRDLHFLFLPSPLFASPSLHRLPSGVLSWHWLCDLTFLSWLNGVASRAGDALSPDQRFRTDRIRTYICGTYGITDDNWRELLPAPGAKLDSSFLPLTVTLCDAHLGPEWPGIFDAARSIGYDKPMRTEIFDPAAYREFTEQQEYERKKNRAKSGR